MKYWMYVHDDEGELIYSLGERDSFESALFESAQEILFLKEGETLRIVDNETHNTIWLAGPVNEVNALTFQGVKV